MKLSFNLEDISYLKISYIKKDRTETVKLGLKEKRENDFIAATEAQEIEGINPEQKISVSFITRDGLYKTETELREVYNDEDYTYFVIANPDTLDYYQNREYFRVLVEQDCIYSIDEEDEVKSYNAKTYDVSPGGVSIIMDEFAISTEESSIVIFADSRDIRSHLRFIRCEIYENQYKLSFEFTDLSNNDYKYLSDLCLDSQLRKF